MQQFGGQIENSAPYFAKYERKIKGVYNKQFVTVVYIDTQAHTWSLNISEQPFYYWDRHKISIWTNTAQST